MKRKFLSLLLALTLIAGGVPLPVAAAESTVTTEGELTAAVASAASGDTIKLGANITLANVVKIANKSIILDLNGYTMISGGAAILMLKDAALEVKDTSPGAAGVLSAGSYGDAIDNALNGSLTVGSGTVTAGNGNAISNSNAGSVVVSGGTVSALGGMAIFNNKAGTVTVSGGVVSAKNSPTIYSNEGKVTVSGGMVSTENRRAIQYLGTDNITISGGTVIGTQAGGMAIVNSNIGRVDISGGTVSAVGPSPAIYSCNMVGSQVNISGGTVTKVRAKVLNLSGNPVLTAVLNDIISKKVNITGELTGADGGITLDGTELAVKNNGTAVATATDANHAVAAKLAIANVTGMNLAKSGANIVLSDPNAFTSVTGITGVPTEVTAGTALTLSGTVEPAGATNKTLTWAIGNPGTTGAAVSGTTFTATSAGTATVVVTIENGLSATTPYTQIFTITVNPPADPDAAAVSKAKTAAEGADYPTTTQALHPTEASVKAYVETIAETAVANPGVTTTVNTASYTAPVAGTALTPFGTDGIYRFTLTLNKNSATQTTAEKTVGITATPLATYGVTGTVTDGTNPFEGATVRVMYGKTQIGLDGTTAAGGSFTIPGISNGTYNLVVTKADQIVTKIITVSGADCAAGEVTLPSGKKNSVVEVKNDTPPVVVGGLHEQFKTTTSANDKGITSADHAVAEAGGTVEIRLTAEGKTADTAANAEGIKSAASAQGKTVALFIDLSVLKTVRDSMGVEIPGQSSALTELAELVEVLIPLDAAHQGKTNYVVYRYHGTAVDTLTTTANGAHEKIELINGGKTLKATVKKFSTYALAYTAPGTGGTTGGGGSSSRTVYTITVKAGEGGVVSPQTSSVEQYASKTFTMVPNQGYKVSDVLVNGVSVGAVSEYTFTRVDKAQTLEVKFAKAEPDRVAKIQKVTVTSAENPGIPYYLNAGEKMVFIGYSANLDGKMTYIAPPEVTVLFKENPKTFTDLSGHWAKGNIDTVTSRELFVGTAPAVFSPDQSMTRAMFATVIGRLHEASYGKIPNSTKAPFTDMAYDSYYAPYVIWAAENGIVSGMGGGRFEPDRSITRQEMAVLISNYMKFKGIVLSDRNSPVAFTDASHIESWAKSQVEQVQKLGVMSGIGENQFSPQGVSTRAQVAAVLERMVALVLK